MNSNQIGVLTLAIPKDFKKAIALALTLRERTPELPIAVVCPSSLVSQLEFFFDEVIVERPDLKGFEHKLYLDEYSPYDKTFFFDSDVLIIKDILPTMKLWSGSAYAVRGNLATSGISSFGLNREFALKKIHKKHFSVIDGAGHAYFEKPACYEVFDKAREILCTYEQYQADKFADEDAMGIAMTMLDIEPKQNNGFLGSPWCAVDRSFHIDTDNGICSYKDLIFGNVEPRVVHFPRFIYPFIYAREMAKTYRRHNEKISGIYPQALKEVLITELYWPLLSFRRKVLGHFRNFLK
jgi:hypothetical protein